jgi:hypothetical protein
MFRFFYIFSCCTPTLSVVAHCFEFKLKLVYEQVDKQCSQVFCDCYKIIYIYIYMKVAFFPSSLICVLCDLDLDLYKNSYKFLSLTQFVNKY